MVLCLSQKVLLASEADTLLNLVLSKPVFYNVMQNSQGEVFAGTAEGIFRIKGEVLSQFDRRSGYIKFTIQGEPEIDSTGISNYENFQFLHLLPFPDEQRQVYYTGTEEQFYMVSGGRLYVFDIVPYGISYRNQSIRSVSRHLVGGYSGVFLNGQKLDFPSYTDGFIREFGDTAFICYGGLYRITPRERQNFSTEVPFGGYLDGVHLGYMDDIYYDSKHAMYVLSSQTGVYVVGSDLRNPRKILSVSKDDPVVLLGSKESFVFTVANRAYTYSFESGRISLADTTSEKILGGVKFSNRIFYTLSAQSLYQTATKTFYQKIASFNDVHTMVALNEKELIIAGNQGLYLFQTESRTTSVLISGVEFNRRALYSDGEKLYAGSVNGLYTIDLKQLPKLIQRNKAKLQSKSSLVYVVSGIGLLLIAIFGWIIFRLKRKLKTAEQRIQENEWETVSIEEIELDKDKIIEFIRMNLSTASIKSINEHFGSNTNQLYALFEPEKPGTIIQRLRTELVISMKKNNATLAQISAATGFSQSYIKKIRMVDV